MKLHPFLPLALFLGSLSIVSAQRTGKWVLKEEKADYVEGTFSLNVNNVLEIISLTSSVEPYAFGKEQQLYFDYYAPEEAPYFLRMGEKRLLSYYVLESRPGNTPKGWNTFGPCPVDGLLKNLKVPAENIGVLLRINGDDSKYFLPVAAYHSRPPQKTESYKAVFRLSRSILRGEYNIYKGEHRGIPPAGQLVESGSIGRHSARSTFQVEAPADKLRGYEGWVTVDLSLTPRGSSRDVPFRFYIYNSNSSQITSNNR